MESRGGAEPGHLKFHPDPPDRLLFPLANTHRGAARGSRWCHGLGRGLCRLWVREAGTAPAAATVVLSAGSHPQAPVCAPSCAASPAWPLLSGSLNDSRRHLPACWVGRTAQTGALAHGRQCCGGGMTFPGGWVTQTHLAKASRQSVFRGGPCPRPHPPGVWGGLEGVGGGVRRVPTEGEVCTLW